jgi:hypothetical protein
MVGVLRTPMMFVEDYSFTLSCANRCRTGESERVE